MNPATNSSMDDVSLLGERLAKARQNRGYSAPQLAQRMGIKPATIDRWESGETVPRANRLHQLSGILNVPLLWLMGGGSAPPSVEAPRFSETHALETRIERAEALIGELSFLLVDIRAQARKLQRELDDD